MSDNQIVLMTIGEAAKAKHVHPYTAIRLRELECYRIGSARRAIRVSEEQLQAWLDHGVRKSVA
jgi:hypothetical protein